MSHRFLCAIVAVVALPACDFFDDGQAKRVVEQHGFTNVTLTGRRLFGCGRDDSYRVGFRATNPRGDTVTGVVCGGMLVKAYTMRLD